jgi:hypothetical protein
MFSGKGTNLLDIIKLLCNRHAYCKFVLAFSLLITFLGFGSSDAAGRKSDKGEVVLLFNGLKIPAEYAGILVGPDEVSVLKFFSRESNKEVEVLNCEGVGWCQSKGNEISWQSPEESGDYWMKVHLKVFEPSGLENPVKSEIKKIEIACLVGFPSSLLDKGFINGYEVGEYPNPAQMNNPAHYVPPENFFLMDYDVIGVRISEHLMLGDLGYDVRESLPQYFALDYELVKKLELIHEELSSRGLPCRYHFIGGGFVSPKSNRKRTSTNGAAAKLSRHMYGEAIDFIIDEDPRDEVMDDLNKDGIIDVRDALYIRDMINEFEEKGLCTPGGFGVYSPPRNSRIQVHVDVRGFPTRWGYKEYDKKIHRGIPPKKGLRPGN